jgi:hypothetical protein
MRGIVDAPDREVDVVLSRRNLRVLLQKLDMAGSARTIYIDTEDGWRVYVKSEDDEEHYVDRAPGEMHPQTELEL